MHKLGERDPFVGIILRSVVATFVLVFLVGFALEYFVPELRHALFVPSGAAIACGSLAFQVELKRKCYAFALLEILIAVAIFPVLGWFLIKSFEVPYESGVAIFIAWVPVVLFVPEFFLFVRKRFHTRESR